MSIQFNCPSCGKNYSVGEQLAGKQAKCKACGATMSIPLPAVAPLEDDPLEYGIKEDPFAAASSLAPLPPKPRTAAAAPPKKKSGMNSGLKTLLYVVGGIAGIFAMIVIACCGILAYLPSAGAGPSGPGFAERLNAYAYKPIPAVTSSHGIPGSDVRVAFVQSHGSGPAGKMQLRIYMPPGDHQPGSLPCVLVAPAGTPLLYGCEMDDDDYHDETLPYAEAGMVVVFYSIDGPEDEEDPADMQRNGSDAIISYEAFRGSCAGVMNGKNAIDYVLQNVPQVNPNKIYTAGHSSAGTLSLLLAAHEPRLAGAIAYAPCSDVEGRLAALTWVPGVNRIYPGLKQFLHDSSPNNNVSTIQCPVFLFHARDDSNVEISESQAFSKQLAQAGVDVTFETVETGEHYESMIDEGVPKGVQWIRQKASQR
ncbi:prolyl oligopeptidase family serine peptidase [Blastopirellula sp. JC732]|uniref:Prolyl oligopeptidase family serine peptidase n=1 Tax=Blastopirellula sediminis TaxID=2894196 RepID=A0A9X1MR49_9BACT|nr:prolyl oligopeptidase family serine peptidase [Blastopirellula sediminis]MCC9605856.1 prolyl oligopeptidase family serine peptidase [Blastopirellula sediminis]MCC9630845.1 prolyl oligopeptidase family serine peptidase [Blastopirellula sediminis]